jgi:hypothetical protein
MDLPVEERVVDIFTYVSSFSKEQIAKRDEDGGIPKSIQEVDGDQDPLTKSQRIFTSDQKVLDVALRKEKIAKELLDIMKEAAIDCTLNAADNEPMECLVLKEGSNPYMFDPDLSKDEITTGAELAEEDRAPRDRTSMAAEVKRPAVELAIGKTLTIGKEGKKRTILLGEPNRDTGIANVYDELDQLRTKPIGTIRRGFRAGSTIGWTDLKFNR